MDNIKAITRAQLDELEEDEDYNDIDIFNKKPEEYTGIKAIRCDMYQYFDTDHSYVGNSEESPLIHMLKRAGVEVLDE